MLTGRIQDRELYEKLLRHEVWRRAFEALGDLHGGSELGVSSIGVEGAYLDVHTYKTAPAERCVWESHRNTVDLQYVIEGSELVDYAPVDTLGDPTSYAPEQDRLEYAADVHVSRLHLPAGRWAIFFPGDGHRPMIRTEQHTSVLKAVVKIDQSILLLDQINEQSDKP